MAKEDPKKLLKEVGEEALYIQESINSISGALNKNLKEFNKVTEDTQKIFNNTLSTSTSLGKKLAEINVDSLKSSKERKSLEEQLLKNVKEISSLERQKEFYVRKASTARGAEQKSLLKIAELLGDAIEYSKDQVQNAERLNRVYIDIEKNLGITGNLLNGINEIPILNKFIDTKKALEAANQEASKLTGSRWKTLGATLDSLGTSLRKNLTDPLVLFGTSLAIFKSLIDLGLKYDQITSDIAKNQGISTSEAEKTQQYLREAASSSRNLLATTENFAVSQAALNDSFGTSADFSSKTLENFTDLTKKLGLTNEEASALAGFSLTTGKTSEQIVNNIGKQNKGVLNNKKIISEVAKINGQLFAQYKGSPDLLAKAVIQTQKLGMSLQQAQNVSKNLLNFEDSISAELEAELLTGKDLNLEKARYLALQGKSAEAAEELMKNVGSLEDFTRLNVIQQEALARAVGMSTDELADSLRKQQQIKELNQGQVKLYQKQIQELKNKGRIEEANALEQQMLQGKSFELSKLQLSAQEKLSAASDKLKDSFNSIIAGPIGDIISKFADLISKIASSGLGKIALGGAAIIGLGTAILAMARVFGKMALNGYMNVKVVGGNTGGGGDITDNLDRGKGAGMGKQLKTLFKNPKTYTRALKRAGGGSIAKGLGKGLLKGGLKGIPLLGGLISSGLEIAEGGFNLETLGRSAISGLGSIGGGLLGSLIAPGAGTVGGAIGGGLAGDWLANKIFGDRQDLESPPMEDFIMRPGQPVQKFRKDDIVIGGTNLTGGENNGEVITLLKELITTIKQGGNVYLDGTKVGTAMAVGTFKTQ